MTIIAEVDRYEDRVCEQRRRREAMLREERGWLTLAGLFWLQPGANRFGKAPDNDLVLPGATTPDHAGLFVLQEGTTSVEAPPGVLTTAAGQPITCLALNADDTATPDYLRLGKLTLVVIKRKARVGVRVWDAESPVRKSFGGLRWYPVRSEYCIAAQYTPYDPPRPLPIVDVLGDAYIKTTPGYVHFAWQGQEHRLEAEERGGRLFFNFGDGTNGDTTYPAGRFLYADPPANARVTLDFNLATNPFCAYSPYATCPLPPPQNRLSTRIEAGEMNFQPGGDAQ